MNSLLLLCLLLAGMAGLCRGDKMKSFPYQAYILHNEKHICGGAIISTNKIMTLGKCLLNPLNEYTIRVGSADPNSGGEMVTVKKMIRHPDYNDKSGENDIALAELSTPLTFNNLIKPVPLRERLERSSGQITWIMKPVVSKYNSSFWNDVTLIPPKLCKERYNVTVSKDKNCFILNAASASGECKIMQGDPLVDGGYLVGLVAENYVCDQKKRFLFGILASYFIGRFLDSIFRW